MSEPGTLLLLNTWPNGCSFSSFDLMVPLLNASETATIMMTMKRSFKRIYSVNLPIFSFTPQWTGPCINKDRFIKKKRIKLTDHPNKEPSTSSYSHQMKFYLSLREKFVFNVFSSVLRVLLKAFCWLPLNGFPSQSSVLKLAEQIIKRGKNETSWDLIIKYMIIIRKATQIRTVGWNSCVTTRLLMFIKGGGNLAMTWMKKSLTFEESRLVRKNPNKRMLG